MLHLKTFPSDVIWTPFSQGTEHNCWLFPSCYDNRSVIISHLIRGAHGIQCMPCSSRIIREMLPEIPTMDLYLTVWTPFSQGTERNCWLFPSCYDNRSIIISHLILGEHGIQCMPCSSRIIREMLPEILTMDLYVTVSYYYFSV